MPEWKFRTMKLSEQNRDPVESEFFRRGDAVESLIREAIQNSLDAGLGNGPIRVRFYVSGNEYALSPLDSQQWLTGLAPHLKATDTASTDLLDGTMPFITVEDFGTRGLQGDPTIARKSEVQTSGANQESFEDFFYFWRNVGITGKSGTQRGSWGLGKAVYASSSDIRSVLGLTVRSDDSRSLLMGQCVLGIHDLNNASGVPTQHDAYGFFGEFGTRNEDPDFAVPTEDKALIDQFRTQFKLERHNESGLSLVVPFPSQELLPHAAAPWRCADEYALEVIQQFAYPILANQLKVDIVTPAKTHHLNRETLLTVLDGLSWETGKYDRELTKRLLTLALWAIDGAGRIELQRNDGLAARWEDIEFPGDTLGSSRERFNQQQPLAFRVPVLVRPKSGGPELAHFDVLLQHDPTIKGNAIRFVRQGLTLSEIQGSAAAGLVGLVTIEHDALAKLLRDAENPAHTRWLTRSEQLKKHFIGGPDRVAFVEKAPRVLLRRLLDSPEKLDTELLADFFPDPDPEAAHPGTKGGEKKGPKQKPPGPVIAKTVSKPIRIHRVAGGFAVARDPSVPLPSRTLQVEMAFDVVSGNPFKAWKPFDFSTDTSPIETTIVGGSIKQKSGNKVLVRIDSDDFHLEVRGFPDSRDLAVKDRLLPEGDGDETL